MFTTGQKNSLTLVLVFIKPWASEEYGPCSKTMLNIGITWVILNATLRHSALIAVDVDLGLGIIERFPSDSSMPQNFGITDLWYTWETYMAN